MADYLTIEEYSKHLKTLNIDQLIDIADHIDKEKYPDRYNIVLTLIREKDKEPRQVPQSSPIKIPRWQSFLWYAFAWLFLTFLIYWKWGNIAPEQSYLYYLYPFFSAYIIAGISFEAWYLTTFRMAVGRPKFFFTLFVGIFLLILTIIIAEKGYAGIKLFLIFFILSLADVGLVVALYKNAKKKIK